MYYDTLCLSGGGVDGIQMLGSLQYLSNKNIINLRYIKNYTGTSVGSLICFLLNLKYTIKTISSIIYTLNLEKINFNFDIDDFFENFGIDNGNRIISIIQTLLNNKLNIYDITFEELYNKTNKHLKIIVVNFTDRVEELCDYKNTPKLSVIYALRMSISIPFIFYPVKYKNKLYVDGGLMNNFGINYCNINRTIGICIENESNSSKAINILDYLKQILNIIYTNVTIKNYKSDNIIILKSKKNISEISLDKTNKLKMLKSGYKQTKYKTKYNLHFFAIKYVNNIISKSILVIKN